MMYHPINVIYIIYFIRGSEYLFKISPVHIRIDRGYTMTIPYRIIRILGLASGHKAKNKMFKRETHRGSTR